MSRLLIGIAVCLGGGCRQRDYYRRQADRDVYQVLAEKRADPRWDSGPVPVMPDPRSRFADPYCPNHPPMPTDDPAARYLSPKPQDMPCTCPPYEGYGYLQLLPPVEPDQSSARDPFAPLDSPEFLVGPNNMLEVGLINSRDYQSRRESLYLAALDVTLERFAFGPQYFATKQFMYEHIGRLLPGGDRPSHVTLAPGPLRGNVVSPGETPGSEAPDGQTVPSFTGPGPLTGSGVGVSRLFANGGALLLQFANQTVFELTGPFQGTFSRSQLSLDFVQPLLQGGGQAVTLEPLTQSERNLLYELRSYARFQREFLVSLSTGADLEQGARLEQGQSSDDDSQSIRRRVGLLPLLEQRQIVQNEQQNLAQLQAILERFEALHRAEEVSLIQVDQVRQDVAQARSRVLRARRRYFSNLDRFKLQLGLPTDLPLAIDDQLLAPFRMDPVKCQFTDLPKRLEAPAMEPQEAVALALENRLDLMNARALLVDHWRKIAVSANGLLGVLDFSYNGSWLSPDPDITSQPFNFDRDTARHRVSLHGELPLVRRRERNIYRATLIEYQQARRRLMQAEDVVRLEIRNALRELQRSAESFGIQHEAVILACRRVDQTRRLLEQPPRPGEPRELGTNAARNLLESQEDLVEAQNDLIQSWVDFQTARLELWRDLEILDTNDPFLFHIEVDPPV